MPKFLKTILFLFLFLSFWSFTQKKEPLHSEESQRQKIEMVTDYGTMIIELYDETPMHRDNFINLTNNKAYDSLLFHRVINSFMIQGGDPDSKNAKPIDTLGEGDAPYVVKAEFNENLFHKKGVLAAARDDHPERSSSAMQFYIVQGMVYNDSSLIKVENYMNKSNAEVFFKNNLEKKPLLDSIKNAMDNRNLERYNFFRDSIYTLANSDENFKPYTIPEKQRDVYKTIGGTPHLDQNYTVFGEVVEGIEIIDSIAGAKTNALDRPINDIRIQSVSLKE